MKLSRYQNLVVLLYGSANAAMPSLDIPLCPQGPLNKRDAASFLIRTTRSNSGMLEELKPDNLQRECIEEACDYGELQEAIGSETKAEVFWVDQTQQCGNAKKASPCVAANTDKCINGWGDHKCMCKSGYYGKNCDNGGNDDETNVVIPENITDAVDDATKVIPKPKTTTTTPATTTTTTEAATTTTTTRGPTTTKDWHTAIQEEQIRKNKAQIQAELDRMAPIPALLDMMSAMGDESTRATIETLRGKFDEIRARLLALLNDHYALLTDTQNSVNAMNNLMNQIYTKPAPRASNYTVECGNDYMSIDFNPQWLKSMNMVDEQIVISHTGGENCADKVFSTSGRVTVALDDGCMINKYANKESLNYRFDMLMPPRMEVRVVTGWGNHWEALCTYNRYDTATTLNRKGEIKPVLKFPEVTDEETKVEDTYHAGSAENAGEFRVRLDVALTGGYSSFYDNNAYPLGIEMGNRINAQLKFVNASMAKHLFMVAESCWGHPDEASSNKVSLLAGRCPSNTLASLESRNYGNIDRFSSKVFKFPGAANPLLFITCRVRICQDADDCDRSCSNSIIKRRRRSAHQSLRRSERSQTFLTTVSAPGAFYQMGQNQKVSSSSFQPVAIGLLVVVMLSFIAISIYSIRRDRKEDDQLTTVQAENVAATNAAFDTSIIH